MWIMPLYLHVKQKSDYDDMIRLDIENNGKFHEQKTIAPNEYCGIDYVRFWYSSLVCDLNHLHTFSPHLKGQRSTYS